MRVVVVIPRLDGTRNVMVMVYYHAVRMITLEVKEIKRQVFSTRIHYSEHFQVVHLPRRISWALQKVDCVFANVIEP